MSKDKKPQVIMPPHIRREMEADPELKAALDAFSKTAVEAMEGVTSGKYPSFDVAMEFLTGHAPRQLNEEDSAAVLRGEIPPEPEDDSEEPMAN